MISPTELQSIIRSGLLSFPITPFDKEDEFASGPFKAHLEWLSSYDVSGLIVAGGTGEMFSLSPAEIVAVVKAAREVSGDSPVIAGCGYGTRMACDLAKEIEAAGGDGILLLPHYLIGAPQEGIADRIRSVCKATNMGVIVYNRGQACVSAEMLAQLAEECPNLIGFKDGTGDIDTVRRVTTILGDRLSYIGGMPTHELFAQAYRGAGMGTYSSAVFNFVPETALKFHAAFVEGDDATCEQLLRDFYYPFAKIRDRKKGYAVSAIKAGVKLRGFETGPVRSPLTDLTEEEQDMLLALINAWK
ncbi:MULTISPECIES: 5-dehydro-4-deoxyglucarate dehydratase [Thalassospira]|uniref:5-dehydro-4-deoxyglucarate dehydratase n=1 Tax=Thalassospira TaxID=168934 RepID=UPI000C0AC400|nr:MULTISPECIES: 5-dehydro-4-deoxyglucarate dehydratase [Thalassospira]MAC33252.1 5-dehydro-4-deoxyglucarate dehydratase [Haliea sp.]MBR9782183.1 5-dehydro-4-deoxyglucarate dehydratase [Rhodospirillales bacterium]MBR9816745.1 5-dehydro-4-deoxyglucarate dehydratase [Rhodospirillales bacterium]HBS21705.1 5-dehydro-4-deoxyglucarate dehydratase [Thalassospira sp.]|tara:strand:+ start:149 stop:1054 length:906 start_codon:yes stop_codon:yes gene_type:complete